MVARVVSVVSVLVLLACHVDELTRPAGLMDWAVASPWSRGALLTGNKALLHADPVVQGFNPGPPFRGPGWHSVLLVGQCPRICIWGTRCARVETGSSSVTPE